MDNNSFKNTKISNLINPSDNDNFSKMNKKDLKCILHNLDNYYLELRDKLGFDDYITFGLELEFEQAMETRLENIINEMFYENWNFDGEESDFYKLAEISSPILKDNNKTWYELKEVCSIVKQFTTINNHSGGHIHIGTQVLGNNVESWLNFIKLWSVYENIVYRFTYGSYLTARRALGKTAKPMKNYFWECYLYLDELDDLNLKEIINQLSLERYQAVNFENVKNFNSIETKNTIEFRCPNATLEPVIWQNNVNLFVNLLKYSKSETYDNSIIDRRRNKNKNKIKRLNSYGNIYLEQALELCDMIFDNNFDKVYFLRQYLKSFEIGKKSTYKEGKTFIKK